MENKNFLKEIPIAHRGLHDDTLPENSLSAFRAAVEHGYAIETDVRFTANDRIVVFHDDDLTRMTGDSRLVSDCTISELKQLRLGGTDEQIPYIGELLRLVDGKVPLLVEIKNMKGVKGKKIARALAAELKSYKGPYAIQSFNPFYAKAYKKLCPDVPCGVLGSADKSSAAGFRRFVIRTLCFNFTVKPDFVSYRLEDLPRKNVDKFKGIKLAWVVRGKKDEAHARSCADNIIFEDYLP